MPDTIQGGAAQRALTYGEKAVGLTFNPSANPDVDKVKALCAQVIDVCKSIVDVEPTYGAEGDTSMRVYSERGQLALEAIRQMQTAQMWVVKAITYHS